MRYFSVSYRAVRQLAADVYVQQQISREGVPFLLHLISVTFSPEIQPGGARDHAIHSAEMA